MAKSIADSFAALNVREKCRFGQILDELSGDDRAAVNDFYGRIVAKRYEDENGVQVKYRQDIYTSNNLIAVLQEHGHQISRNTLASHIRGDCACV